MTFRIETIPATLADEVRATLRSPQYGHQAFCEIAAGYGPCRQCLCTFETGVDERILFTYNAFEGLLEVPLPGPVFIHSERCATFAGEGFAATLIGIPMLFEAYTADGQIRFTDPVRPADAESQIEGLLEDQSIKFINIRNAEAGCHIARIRRV